MGNRTIAKLVTFRLDGDLVSQGFRVTLEIGLEGQRPSTEVMGVLPPDPELAERLKQWQQSYRNLKLFTRIKPQRILYRGSINSTENCQRRSLELRDRLSQWMASSSFSTVDRHLREELNRDDVIQILIRTADPLLWQLPWYEWDLIDRYPKAEVALSAATFKQVVTSHPTAHRSNVRILAILGDATGLDITADRNLLQTLPNADVTFLVEPSRTQLTDRLWDQPWDILFFAGHSQTEGQTGRIYLNSRDSLTLEELKYGLKQAIAQGLQVAIFNSCDGLGLAHQLEQLHLPQMIVMREPVPDQIAHAFLTHFLTAYASGQSLYLAVRQARERLQALESEFPCASWLPVIYQNPATMPPTWTDLAPPNRLLQTSRAHPSAPFTGHRSPQAMSFWRMVSTVLAASILVTGCVIGIRGLGGLQFWELQDYDRLIRLQPQEKQDNRLLMITIDDADIQYQEQQGMMLQGSLSDQALEMLLEKLKPLKPHSIGLDLYRSGTLKVNTSQPPLFAICKVPAVDGGDPYGVNPPSSIPLHQIGFSDFVVDRDDVLRRHLLAIKNPALISGCVAQNSFSLLLALHYLQTAKQYSSKLTSNQELQIGNVVLHRLTANAGGYQGSDAAGYQLLLRYRSYRSPNAIAQTVPLRQVLQTGFSPSSIEQLRDRIVLIGVIASSSSDQWLTPYNTAAQTTRKLPGVLLQAQMVSQLLSAVLDERTLMWWWSDPQEWGWIWTWSLLGGVLAWTWRRWLSLSIAGLLSLLLLYSVCYYSFTQAGWIPLAPSALALLLTQVVVLGMKWRFKTRSDREVPHV